MFTPFRIALSHATHFFALLVVLLLAPVLVHAAPPVPLHELARHPLGGDGGWDYLTVDAVARRLYIARSTRVMVVHSDTGALLGEVPGLEGAHGVVPVPSLGQGFATSGRTGELVAFDLKSLAVTARAKVGENPDALLFEPFSQQLFAFNGKSKDVAIVAPDTLKVAQTLALGGKPEFAVSDGHGRVFVNVEDTSELVALHVQRGQPVVVLKRYPLAPCQEPTGLAWMAKPQQLLVGCSNSLVVIVDANTGDVVQEFKAGEGIDAVAYDAARGLAYISARAGVLNVLKQTHGRFAPLPDVPTQKGSRTLALDAKSGHVFLPAAQFDQPPTPPGGQPPRPTVVAGTFAVIVVGTK